MPTNNPTPEISSHANTITFLDQSNTITQIAYVDGSLVISDGQPVTKPPTITQNGSTLTPAPVRPVSPIKNVFVPMLENQEREHLPGDLKRVPWTMRYPFLDRLVIALPDKNKDAVDEMCEVQHRFVADLPC